MKFTRTLDASLAIAIALAIMNVAWIKSRRVLWIWAALGILTGSCGLVLSLGLGVVFAPLAFVLAIFCLLSFVR
jgi:nucleoside permease NupC